MDRPPGAAGSLFRGSWAVKGSLGVLVSRERRLPSRVRWVRGAAGALVVASLVWPAAGVAQQPADALPPTPTPAVQPRMGEGVAIEVNGDVVSSYDVFQRVKWLLYWSGLRPTESVLVQVENEARRMLVDEALQVAELQRIGAQRGASLIVSDAAVEARIDRMARQRKMTGPGLLAKLVDQDIDSATIYEMFRAQMSWDSFIQARYSGRITLKPEQVAAQLANRSSAAGRDMLKVREISVPLASGGRTQGGKEFAEALWAEIVSGRVSFADIATQFSAAASASKGGDVGWLSLDDLPQAARATIQQMTPGQISPLVEVDGQIYIYYIDDILPSAGRLAFDLYSVVSPGKSPGPDAPHVAALTALKNVARSCADIDSRKGDYPGLVFEKLSNVNAYNISASFKDWLSTSEEGRSSPVVASAAGSGFLMVCAKRREMKAAESEDDIKERLYLEQLVLLSKRDLRNLRQAALVIHNY